LNLLESVKPSAGQCKLRAQDRGALLRRLLARRDETRVQIGLPVVVHGDEQRMDELNEEEVQTSSTSTSASELPLASVSLRY
jgi:hypothetical protein